MNLETGEQGGAGLAGSWEARMLQMWGTLGTRGAGEVGSHPHYTLAPLWEGAGSASETGKVPGNRLSQEIGETYIYGATHSGEEEFYHKIREIIIIVSV